MLRHVLKRHVTLSEKSIAAMVSKQTDCRMCFKMRTCGARFHETRSVTVKGVCHCSHKIFISNKSGWQSICLGNRNSRVYMEKRPSPPGFQPYPSIQKSYLNSQMNQYLIRTKVTQLHYVASTESTTVRVKIITGSLVTLENYFPKITVTVW